MTDKAETLRQEAAEHEQRAADSWERSDTDGFVSQWASGLSAQKARAEADLVEAGGVAEFVGLFDSETGERVRARLVNVRAYGGHGTVSKWVVLDADDNAVEWVAAFKTGKRSKLFQLGLEERFETAAARVDFGGGSGRGLSGAVNVRVVTLRTDGGFGEDAVVWKEAT